MPASTTAEIESVLLGRVATGDTVAFGQLYDRMQPRILGLAMRVLRDSGLAEEVAQEVFLDVWQFAAQFDDSKGSAAGWILRKTHSRAVDRVRSAQAQKTREARIGLRDLNETTDDIADTISLRIESKRVERALGALPEPQRQAVALAHLGGYSHSEVSAILKVPVGTVKTRIRAGIGRLREELAAA
jgi:RNA polymerase sigma-70 factor (ECF subfamily)